MSRSWDDERRAFAEASGWFADLVTRVGDRWEQPGLGEWDVRALVGHTTRALLTVETYLARGAAGVEVASAADYYHATSDLARSSEVTQRGRDAGRDLGPDPVAAVGLVVARVLPLLADKDGNELVGTVAGGMRLRDYLPTRVLELVVHGADLAAALGLPSAVPALAATSGLHLLADLAVADGSAGAVLRALTGRTGLAPGFTLL